MNMTLFIFFNECTNWFTNFYLYIGYEIKQQKIHCFKDESVCTRGRMADCPDYCDYKIFFYGQCVHDECCCETL